MMTSPSMPITSVMCVMRRMPSRMRLICTISCSEPAIWVRIALGGRLATPMVTMFSSRVSASRGRLACSVPIEPSWPVFMACSRSIASGPRTSPRMMRSGRMRSAFFTRSRMLTSPLPSRLAGRVSSRTTCGCCMRSSAASSMVTTRSPLSIMPDSALSSVVLPEPVPPDTTRFSRQRAAMRSTVAMAGEMLPWWAIWSKPIWRLPNLRIDTEAPSMASGGMMMLTRLPSSRRASQIGLDSSTRRPMRLTMRLQMLMQMGVVLERHRGQVELAARARRRSAWAR